MSSFTEQQQQALDGAYQRLSEQFEGVLIAVVAPTAIDESIEATKVIYYGGHMLALGLATQAKETVLYAQPNFKEEP